MALVANYRGKASANTGTTTLELPLGGAGSASTTLTITVPSGTTYVAIKSITTNSAYAADVAAINTISEAVISGTTATFTVNYYKSTGGVGTRGLTVEYVYG